MSKPTGKLGTKRNPLRPEFRKLLRVTQSPLNPQRWVLDLECGHERRLTATRRPKGPKSGVVYCPDCTPREHRLPPGDRR